MSLQIDEAPSNGLWTNVARTGERARGNEPPNCPGMNPQQLGDLSYVKVLQFLQTVLVVIRRQCVSSSSVVTSSFLGGRSLLPQPDNTLAILPDRFHVGLP